MAAQSHRLATRFTPADLAQIDTIADTLRLAGIKYPSMADAIRYALTQTVAALALTPQHHGP
jgi:hypothetical protein